MTGLILFIYGGLVIASTIMILAWGKAARDLWVRQALTLRSARWCKAFVIASALWVHACAMVVSCSYRAADIMFSGMAVTGSEAAVLLVGIGALFASKIAFVWAGSIDESGERVRWPWWAFLYFVLLWAICCVLWEG